MQVFTQVKSVLFKVMVLGFAAFLVGCAGLDGGSKKDASTPEGALYEMFTAMENADIVTFMSVIDMSSISSDEIGLISDEQMQMALKMMEPKLKPMLEKMSKELKSKKGLAEVRVDSRKQISEDTVELVVTMVMGNGEVLDSETMTMKKRNGRYVIVMK